MKNQNQTKRSARAVTPCSTVPGPKSDLKSSFIKKDLLHPNPRREGEEEQPRRTCQPAAAAAPAETHSEPGALGAALE